MAVQVCTDYDYTIVPERENNRVTRNMLSLNGMIGSYLQRGCNTDQCLFFAG
jgi:hypothetical protein